MSLVEIIITSIVSIFTGGGGVFLYLTNKQKHKQKAHDNSVAEWKQLYDEMKHRLDDQEEENKKLRDEIYKLKEDINRLNLDLANYKKYDTYIIELEKYIDHLLHTCKSLITEEAYRNLFLKKPQKIIDLIDLN